MVNDFEPGRAGPAGELEPWEIEMRSILVPLMASLNSAYWLSTPEAVLASSDQFRAVARDSTKWLLNHHCPIPDLAVSFCRVLRSTVTLAEFLQEQAQCPSGPDWPAITSELSGFHRLLELFQTMMNDHSPRTASDPGAAGME
jgi:hypothetical protein